MSSDSGSTVIVDNVKAEDLLDSMKSDEDPRLYEGLRVHPGRYLAPIPDSRLNSTCPSSSYSDISTKDNKPKPFYKFQIFPCIADYFIKIHSDRLALLALLDR